MKRNRSKYWRGVGLISIFLSVIAGSISAAHAANANPGVLPPNSHAFGMTYGEWSARWWQWTFSLPVDQNPLFDVGGDCSNSANGQSGPVWFLAGAFQDISPVVRNCTVPLGKALFFPIIDVACSELDSGGATSEQELRDCATSTLDLVNDVTAVIDGVDVRNLQVYRTSSQLFTMGPLPDNNVFQFFGTTASPGTTTSAVAEGYYLMVPPLSRGMHTIQIIGIFDSVIAIDITYVLNVTHK